VSSSASRFIIYMSTEKKIHVYKVIPEKLKLEVDNLDLSKIMRNKAIKLVCLLIQKGMQNNHDLSSYIPLPTKYLEKIFNKEYHTDFFNSLKKHDIIECNEAYKHGSIFKRGFSKGYRINQELLNGKFVSTSYQDNKLNDDQDGYIKLSRTYFYQSHYSTSTKSLPDTSHTSSTHPGSIIASTHQTTTSSIMHIPTRLFAKHLILDDLSSLFYDEVKIWEATEAKISVISTRLFKTDDEVQRNYFEVINHTNGLTYHTTKEKAIEWSKNNGVTLIQDDKFFYIDDLDRYVLLKKRNMLLNYKWYMAKLNKNIFYANRNITNNRLDHNLTSLNKDTMKIIKKGNDLIEIDMKNCQFAIHAYWMKQEGLCIHDDVLRYYDMCANGILYDELAEKLNITREEAKQVMMELAFSSEKYYTPNKKLFKEHFPNVVAHIDGFKKEMKNSILFSIELQQLESEIFIDNLYPNIKELGLFCLTKHDSLFVKRADEDRVIELIRAYFNYLELECVLDVEGRLVSICSGDEVPENKHCCVLDARIQDETGKTVEDESERHLEPEREECHTFSEPKNKPDWWQSLDYFKQNYGNDCAKEMYEGQIMFIGKF